MDAGTNALDVLLGHVVPLKLGFVGVVNRSQMDVNQKKSFNEALRAEAAFFQKDATYRSIRHRCGTPYLAKLLNKV